MIKAFVPKATTRDCFRDVTPALPEVRFFVGFLFRQYTKKSRPVRVIQLDQEDW